MTKKILSIVQNAYRATLEEQDDTILWLNQAMRGQGAEISILLAGNGVNYGVASQDASGLVLGEWRQRHPPDVVRDLQKLVGSGVSVYYVEEDAAQRGLEPHDIVPSLRSIGQSQLADLFEQHDLIWRW